MTENDSSIIRTAFDDALSKRYLAYALSTITSRSLPDVRDGLKPVHRRLLYAMRALKLDPGQGYKKSARVVGDVMGKFHPHGDAAIYDAMVRLAQSFAMRYPLVDGQGNFGNIDGDNPAAMRYTEARMSAVAQLLLEGIDEDAVDFRATYDGESDEPVILPAGFPNLLANGAQGIAVGMATSIPPHNVLELADAILLLIKNPGTQHATLMKCVRGPDFPTGGVLVDSPGAISEAYKTGRGGFRLRAKWHVEKRKGSWDVVVDEIPYQIPKGRLVERMAEQLAARKLPAIAHFDDESAEDMRLVLQPKSRNMDPEVMMESMFRTTDLEVRVQLNLNVLDKDGKPGVMGLKEALLAWIDHRIEVLQRRTGFRLKKIAARLEVLEGYLVVFLNLDAVIKIIRNEDEPKPVLMKKFKLNELQADAILNMRLRSLRKLEEMELKSEQENLKKEQTQLNKLLKDDAAQREAVAGQVQKLKAAFAETDSRRTAIAAAPEIAIDIDEMLTEKEPITVILSANGWIRAARGHLAPDSEVKYREGDGPAFMFHAESTDKILIAASNGRFYTLAGDRLPGARGFGEPVSLMVELGADTAIIGACRMEEGLAILVAADTGHGFIVEAAEVMAQTRNGKHVLTLAENARAVVARPLAVADDTIAVVGENRKMLVFPREELPIMARGKGVRLQRYKDGGLADARGFDRSEGITWEAAGGKTRTEADLRNWAGSRAQAGRLAPHGFPKPPRFG